MCSAPCGTPSLGTGSTHTHGILMRRPQLSDHFNAFRGLKKLRLPTSCFSSYCFLLALRYDSPAPHIREDSAESRRTDCTNLADFSFCGHVRNERMSSRAGFGNSRVSPCGATWGLRFCSRVMPTHRQSQHRTPRPCPPTSPPWGLRGRRCCPRSQHPTRRRHFSRSNIHPARIHLPRTPAALLDG